MSDFRGTEGEVISLVGTLECHAPPCVAVLDAAALSAVDAQGLVAHFRADDIFVRVVEQRIALRDQFFITAGSLVTPAPEHHISGLQLRALRAGDSVRVTGRLERCSAPSQRYRDNAIGWALRGVAEWGTLEIAFVGAAKSIAPEVSNRLVAQVVHDVARYRSSVFWAHFSEQQPWDREGVADDLGRRPPVTGSLDATLAVLLERKRQR